MMFRSASKMGNILHSNMCDIVVRD